MMIRHPRIQRQIKRKQQAKKKLTIQRTNAQLPPHPTEERPLQNLTHDSILQLSQQHGNHYVNGLANGIERRPPSAFLQRYLNGPSDGAVIQRMPTANIVIGELGKPRKKSFGKEQSTKYKAVLAGLGDLSQYLVSTRLANDANGIKEQLKAILRLHDPVIFACAAYEGVKGKKARYFQKLKLQAQNEKGAWISKMMELATNPRQFGMGMPLLSNISPTLPMPIMVDESKFKREVGGGVNKLQVYDGGGDQEHFFKENRNQIEDINSTTELGKISGLRQSNPQEFERRKKEIFGKDAMNQNAELAGIDKLNARTAARDVASSRLDALLGAGVIARAQFALRKVGNETKLGSLMIGAKGDTGGSMGTNRRFNVQGGQTDINDPNLQRLLSRLQLLDNLSYQIDRNKGNFYIETDNQGNVTGITGIDNDASFGTKTNVSAQVSDYPGIAKFIDRELAQRIKTLDIELLELAMTDLLTPEEIDALFKRLTILQSAIAQMDDNQLLTPEQWDQAVGLNMLEEKRKWHSGKGSYHGALSKDVHD